MLCFGVLVQAQQSQILNDNQGKPVMEQSYTDVEGSPYFNANWFPGTVNLSSGKAITAKLKYDLVKDELSCLLIITRCEEESRIKSQESRREKNSLHLSLTHNKCIMSLRVLKSTDFEGEMT
ncbi:hypothetical protein GCM10022210_18870 [Mucilaginibacter dorajii]|uniref:Uncharacterized protein n=2 Tax=Mucilaginibacter dorajii TaxID=692994 RepID=A0ABP7PRU9_9SPHI